MCVMPWLMNMEVKNIVVDVVDNDRSTLSQQLVHRIEQTNYFVFNGQKSSYEEALADVERGDADVIVEIPKDYERNSVRGEAAQVLIAANAVNGTKGSKLNFILAKLIPYWIIGAIEIAICFVLSWAVYGITPEGSIALVYLLALMLAFVFSAFGLIISNYNNTMQQAMFVMWFFVVCLMLLSGLFTPVRSMPHWAYVTTYVNPMHYFIDGIRTVFVRGGDMQSIAYNLIVLSAFALIMSCWAMYSYKKRSKN